MPLVRTCVVIDQAFYEGRRRCYLAVGSQTVVIGWDREWWRIGQVMLPRVNGAFNYAKELFKNWKPEDFVNPGMVVWTTDVSCLDRLPDMVYRSHDRPYEEACAFWLWIRGLMSIGYDKITNSYKYFFGVGEWLRFLRQFKGWKNPKRLSALLTTLNAGQTVAQRSNPWRVVSTWLQSSSGARATRR